MFFRPSAEKIKACGLGCEAECDGTLSSHRRDVCSVQVGRMISEREEISTVLSRPNIDTGMRSVNGFHHPSMKALLLWCLKRYEVERIEQCS